jgi:hypothetical protein
VRVRDHEDVALTHRETLNVGRGGVPAHEIVVAGPKSEKMETLEATSSTGMMKKLIAGSLTVLLAVAVATPAFPAAGAEATESGTSSSDVVNLLLRENPSPETRRAAAGLIAKICSAYLSPISGLSPKENAQLDAELKSKQTDRATRANQSSEYSRRYVGDRIGACNDLATSLASGASERKELADWTGLSVVLLDWELVWHIRNLARTGAVHYSKIELLQANDLSWIGQLIVQNIVYPEVRGLDH